MRAHVDLAVAWALAQVWDSEGASAMDPHHPHPEPPPRLATGFVLGAPWEAMTRGQALPAWPSARKGGWIPTDLIRGVPLQGTQPKHAARPATRPSPLVSARPWARA